MISSIRHAPSMAKSILPPLKEIVKNNNLSNLAGQLINGATGICLIVYGAKEIILDSHPTWCRITPNPNAPIAVQKTMKAADWLLMMIRNQPANFVDKLRFTTHGILTIGTGVAGTISAAARLGGISIGPTLRLFDFAAGGLFIAANLIYLEYNIEKFVESVKNLREAGPDKKYTILQLIAAAIGLVSNLGYIAASLATFAAAPFLYPVILGLIGLLTGGLRILLESFIAWKTQTT